MAIPIFSCPFMFVAIAFVSNWGPGQTLERPAPATKSNQLKQVEDQGPSKLHPLISAKQLKELIDAKTPKLSVLEPATKLSKYEQGHIPTAQYLHWVKDMTDPRYEGFYNNLNTDQFKQLVQRLGIENDTRVVIYDRLSSRLAVRLFWTLKYYGHDQVQVLDGGFKVWSKDYDYSTEIPQPKKSSYTVGKPRKKMLVKIDEVKQRLEDPLTKFIDGRPPAQFSGEIPGRVFHTDKPHPRLGHIPNAVNIFWKNNFNPDGTFKSPEQLHEIYLQAGVDPSNRVVSYCNEGLHAAPPWFVLNQLLQYKKVQLYDSSMAEWTGTENPLDVHAKPETPTRSGSGSKDKPN